VDGHQVIAHESCKVCGDHEQPKNSPSQSTAGARGPRITGGSCRETGIVRPDAPHSSSRDLAPGRITVTDRRDVTISEDEPAPRSPAAGGAMARDTVRLATIVGALGVVFGDIGTSPIYTMQTVFNPADPHPVPVSVDNVYGVVSLIFWSVVIIVTVTYVLLAMRADNDGEGGIMALITLLRRWRTRRGRRAALVLAGLGIFGASLFFGDSMITPAIGHFHIAFFALAAVVLAVTGAEALYADMGHFGRRAISRGWLVVVFPACILSYLGQGALILDDPANISSPFFLLVPEWGRLPMVVLATAATVIASQAVITGAFSVAAQAAQLGYLPRLRITHTSAAERGQIYVPWVNWLLMVSVLTLVFAFRTSTALAFAFGMAVTGTITITTLLFFFVARAKWGTPIWLLAIGATVLLAVDGLFLAANLTKLVHGAWLPLLIGLTLFTVMTTWQKGRQIVTAERERLEGPLREFVNDLRSGNKPAQLVPGTAIFLNRGKETTPLALRANVDHNHVRHEHVVIMSIQTEPVPRVPADHRVVVDDLGYADDGITHVTARFGYMETPQVPAALALLDPAATEGRLQLDEASYFLSKIELQAGDAPTMARWRKRLFIATSHITADAADSFALPRDNTVVIGSHIQV
jgi:K+ transporter